MVEGRRGSEIIQKALNEGRSFLMEDEAKALCKLYNIPTTEAMVAKNEDEAVKYAREIGYPVVLKIVSPDIVHKSDVGGVILNIDSDEKVKEAYLKIISNVKKHKPDAKIVGVIVQEMARPSTEVIVGLIKDQQFGPTVMFGLGGVFVEILKDVSFRVCPITEIDAKEMISEIKGYPILKGYRNSPPADIDAIVKILLNVSDMAMDHPEINEMDLNPILVYEKGAKVVDARVILAKS
ncbi:MAG: acetate--CoA ligase family protein [Candidatus Bathyarchaeota archaeon]|nr:acetate--CoA ligase family protein [Candidatus Bathyarchaeota archaeon]